MPEARHPFPKNLEVIIFSLGNAASFYRLILLCMDFMTVGFSAPSPSAAMGK